MKALELLNTISTEWCNEYANNAIDLAIKELEELEIRNCKGCKHYGEHEYEICGAEDFTRIVKGCTLMLKIFDDGFCCNKWETKK